MKIVDVIACSISIAALGTDTVRAAPVARPANNDAVSVSMSEIISPEVKRHTTHITERSEEITDPESEGDYVEVRTHPSARLEEGQSSPQNRIKRESGGTPPGRYCVVM